MASVQVGDFVGEIERILSADKLARPRPYRDRAGRWHRDPDAVWDWWYSLDANSRSYLQRHWMDDRGVGPDVIATRHGGSVDEIMGELCAAVKEARRRSPRSDDPLEWEWDDIAEDETQTVPMLELVGPGEVADRLGVKRPTISQWRARYPDFPTPLAFLDDGRRGVVGRGATGLPVWEWSSVATWARMNGRLK